MKEEMAALFLGLLFSVAVFAFKTAAGEFYLLSGTMSPGKKRVFLAATSGAYALLWLAAILVTGGDGGSLLYLFRDHRIFHGGAVLHLVSAAAFFLWGVLLLTGRHTHHRSRAGWLLAVPCPVCAGAILLSVALGRLLMPEWHELGWIMAGIFFAVNFAVLRLLHFLTGHGRFEAHRLAGRLMIFTGMYFAGLILLVPNLEQVERMYRIASGTAMPELSPAAWVVVAGALGLCGAGWIRQLIVKRSLIIRKENDDRI